ncbi:alanine:cation symporter family protein [Phormidium pseudopriestleyi FRX01]|uniref:Alanine:cation symporter family protein n=1 Tax=Phormidium pseudopriestleyi FRX01 TaxID=1759528 RepID=A0ABS3FZK7_9CYAN|nr:alanine/glycine:cation symporter family protein [Phormidium pseudopriestleyi]MBO0352292.1 alanine:cation symporter family protein [Phormidium pseudopriestleyi FRX01]
MKKRWISLIILFLLALPIAAVAQEAEEAAPSGFLPTLDAVFTQVVDWMSAVLFFDFGLGIPLIVLWLISGAVYFTIRMGFINFRALKHAFFVIQGHYDDPSEAGEVSHFQALAAALSATVGLGNIAGVAIAVSVGGPGAMFWMTVAALFGMTSKFVECTLAQKYRIVLPDGRIAGGPMYYLSRGLAEKGMGQLGNIMASLFAILCIGAAFGGGNMFQANQSFVAVSGLFPTLPNWLYGLVLAFMVSLVIIGGISRIGNVAGALVPAMCTIYVAASLWIILMNLPAIPTAFARIFTEAFVPQAAYGGFLGVLVQGFRRSAFSNEAGLGSAAIAHAAARTEEPVREGIVALLEPFIDTVIICNMTALVVIITGEYANPNTAPGVETTSAAFASVISWFPIVLTLAVFLFAFSTMISWSYYGERSWTYLFGESSMIIYRIIYVFCVFLGTVINLGAILDFSDMMFFAMAFPNMLGGFLLADKVRADLDSYMLRLNSGEMPVYK